ncbi:MAG: site-2 protease family protein [Nanoarchaeota archaeon]
MVFNLFIALDLILLMIILVFLSLLLYKNKKNLGKEGALLLYRTKWGIKLIEKIGGQYKKTLKFLSYIAIVLGYFLMAGIIYLFGNSVWQYLTNSVVLETTGKAPPIAPVLPYFPQLFGWGDFFPAFYFIYFLAAITVVMFVHEFSHGIFAKRWGVRIKSTGFAFLKYFPLIYGAFVEQDDKQMTKKSIFKQMSILSAGVFANILTALLFFILLVAFFNVAYAPSGAVFQDYSYAIVSTSSVTAIGNISLNSPNQEEIIQILENNSNENISVNGKEFNQIKSLIPDNEKYIVVYENAPAINSGLKGIITSINEEDIKTREDLKTRLSEFSPGNKINITTQLLNGSLKNYEITLGEHPLDSKMAYVGIVSVPDKNPVVKNIAHFFSSFRPINLQIKSGTFYTPTLGNYSEFIYYLLFWIVLINLLVGLFNMLPLGFLDGGRFFYLTILAITRKEKIAQKVFSGMGYFILFLLVLLMVRWFFILGM